MDDECPEDFIKGLILSVRSLLPVEPLVDECEKRFVTSPYNHSSQITSTLSNIFCVMPCGKQESPEATHTILGASCE